MHNEKKFGTEPLPGDFRLRYLPVLVLALYGSLNLMTGFMVMAGAKMQADPFWHAPLIFLFSQFGS